MTHEKFGIKICDREGKRVLEVGPHVVKDIPEFAEKIGIVAALWGQAEVNLNCLFAVLLDTTPGDAGKQLKKYNSAAKATSAAREIAAEYLEGEELTSVIAILDRLDLARLMRNRVQHDVWAIKGDDSQRLYAIRSDQYYKFTTKLIALAETMGAESERLSAIVDLADEFAESVCTVYTVADINAIEQELDQLNRLLSGAMFFRIAQRLKSGG